MRAVATAENPLTHLEDWDDYIASRYQEGKDLSEFRNYDPKANPAVAEFYRLNHAEPDVDFVLAKRSNISASNIGKKSIWEAAEYLNTLVDDSDPDTDLCQIEHLLQTSEAIRRDGHPRWLVLAGLVHDLGKVLCLYGEPQWAVVGDTFPVGCAWSDQIVFPEYFAANPDARVPEYQTKFGIYSEHTRPRQRPPLLGTRRIYLPRRQELPARAGAIHAPLPLLLPRPQTWRLPPPHVQAR